MITVLLRRVDFLCSLPVDQAVEDINEVLLPSSLVWGPVDTLQPIVSCWRRRSTLSVGDAQSWKDETTERAST